MEVEVFLTRLERVTRSGEGWTARCPSHDDRDPSLSVTVKNNKILVYCHAARRCSTEEIVTAMRLTEADLFIDNDPSDRVDWNAPLATYTYADEWGTLLHQKQRFRGGERGKTFRVRRPLPNGGWAHDMKGVRRVLYRLPELLAAISSGVPVYVVDGEKDADTLWNQGHAATCDPMGAGKWQTEYAAVLAKATEVIVVADKEEGGLEQAETVAASLNGTPVRIVEARKGKDVTDHIQAGFGVEDLAPISELGKLLDRIETFIRRFVVLSDEQACALTLFVAHCWVVETASVTPYQWITSAEEESGKTRCLEVLELLVPFPIFAASITPAAIYRVIQQSLDDKEHGEEGAEVPTLLIDEIDAVFSSKKPTDDSRAYSQILNSGYRRGMKAYRSPQNGGGKKVEGFEVFCPKVFAGLGQLPRTLASRTIKYELKRRSADEPVEDFIYEDVAPAGERLKEELRTWRDAYVQDSPARPERVPGLRDRGNEVWRTLLSLSLSTASDTWVTRARDAAVELSSQAIEPSWGVVLLNDIYTIMVEEHDLRVVSSVDLIAWLFLIEESPWKEWWEDSKGSPRKLAGMLKPYGIEPKQFRIEDKVVRGYERGAFRDAWKRFLPSLSLEGVASATSVKTPAQSQLQLIPPPLHVTDNPLQKGWD